MFVQLIQQSCFRQEECHWIRVYEKSKGYIRYAGCGLLKDLSTTLINPITKMANLSISRGMFPSIWRSPVIPIFKSGDPLSTSNYRPVSILPTVSEVAEKPLAEQTICRLNTSSFPLHPLHWLYSRFFNWHSQLLDEGGVVWAVFLDFKTAFDTVNVHCPLFNKLVKWLH